VAEWSRSARGGREQGTRSPGLPRAAFISGNSKPAPRRPCRRHFEPEMPDTNTSRRPAHNAARRGRARATGQKRHHGARHARHLDQRPRTRTAAGEQNEVAHASSMRRQHLSAVCASSAPDSRRSPAQIPKAIGTPANTQDPATPTKKMIRLMLRAGAATAATARTRDQQRHRQHGQQHGPDITRAPSRSNANSAIRPMPDRQRRRPPDICNLQRRRGDEALFVGVFPGKSQRAISSRNAKRGPGGR